MPKRLIHSFHLWIILVLLSAAPTLANEPTRIACVGDSITFGARIKNREQNSYPVQLQRLLGDNYEVKNFGVSGRTLLKIGNLPYWKTNAYKAALAFKPNIVIIKLGTNDSKPSNWKFKNEAASDLKEMVNQFRTLPSKPKVYLCFPIPAFTVHGNIRDTIIRNELIPIISQVASEIDAPVIDLYSALSDHNELFPDRLHPNAKGAGIMAKVIANALKEKPITGQSKPWKGYQQFTLKISGRTCYVVTPKITAPGKPWIWRARFFGHEPQADMALLEKGFHLVYMDVAELFGNPKAVQLWNDCYKHMTEQFGLSPRVALEGMSRGGLIIFNWASANPYKVSCIYGDAPVCDIKSWPGSYKGSKKQWEQCKTVYGFENDEQAKAYEHNPIDNLEPLAKVKTPILLICGDADPVVPYKNNGGIIEQRYKKLDGPINVILKKGVGHHPHSLKDPKPIVDFVLTNTPGFVVSHTANAHATTR